MAAVLLALGIPLAVSVAATQQQKVVVDRIDDTARFASLAQFVTDACSSTRTSTDERLETLTSELASYYGVYGIKAGVFCRTDVPMTQAPHTFYLPNEGEVRDAFAEALLSRRRRGSSRPW